MGKLRPFPTTYLYHADEPLQQLWVPGLAGFTALARFPSVPGRKPAGLETLTKDLLYREHIEHRVIARTASALR